MMDRRRLLLLSFVILAVVAVADIYLQRADIMAQFAGNFTVTVEQDEPKVVKQLTTRHTAGDAQGLFVRRSGGNVIIVGEDTDDIVIVAEVRVFADSEEQAANYADQLNIEISQHNEQVHFELLEQNKNKIKSTSINWHITVPQHMAVDVEKSVGTVRIDDVLAPVNLTSTGVATLHNVGPVQVMSEGGVVEVEQVAGDAIVSGSYGEINVHRVAGDVELNASVGAAYVHDVRGNLTVQGSMGGIIIDDVDGDIQATQQFGYIEILRSRGNVDVAITSGESIIQPAQAGALQATVRGGDVTLIVPETLVSAYDFQFKGNTKQKETFTQVFEQRVPDETLHEARVTVESGNIYVRLADS